MANERLYQFPSKAFPVPADIIFAGDSANAFDEVNITIAQLISAYPNLSGIGGLTLGANTFPYSNNSSVITAGSITALGVSLLADSTTGAMQTTLGLAIGTNVEAWSAALDSIAGLTTVANEMLYTTASNTYATIAAAASSVLITSAGSVPSLSQTLPTAVQGNITQLGTQGQALNMGSHQINGVANPTSAADAVNLQTLQTYAQGLNPIGAVKAATTANLNATYSNGTAGVGATLTNAGAQVAFATDGYSASLNDFILVWQQTSTFQNGIYQVTTLGSGATNWVLTRASWYNSSTSIQKGDLVSVENGTSYGESSFTQNSTVVTVGTDAITFTVFFSPQSYTGSTSITTLGTITTGTWAGTAIGATYGGTGVTSFSANALLYASGANTWAALATANSSVLGTDGSGNLAWLTTLPSGLAATNLTLTTPILGTPQSGALTNCTGYTVANLSDAQWTDFSGTIGYGGFSGTPTTNAARYKQIGKILFFEITMTGTSNATSFTITNMPVAAQRSLAPISPLYQAVNNGTSVYTAQFGTTSSSTTLTLYNSNNASGWTNSGTKAITFEGYYECV